MQVTVRFCSVPPQFRGHTRRLAARRLFRVPPCRKGTMHIKTPVFSGIRIQFLRHRSGPTPFDPWTGGCGSLLEGIRLRSEP
ncbi:hypothetical protein TNCV_3421791 [Trichonephila clavipes]|nr:hypothetical protein TNCV_3421791 [Trichonephila clavipes]